MTKHAGFQRLRNRPECSRSANRLALAILLVACGSVRWTNAAEPVQARPDLVDYCIVVTGNELLEGVYADSHTHFITRTLRPLGLHCVGSLSVEDSAPDIKRALAFAAERARLIVVTGGLGPTDNDITRETLADFTGSALREHPAVLEWMERRFRTPRDQLRANLRRQSRVPETGTYLKNETGSAVGLVFERRDKVIVALPGPPQELQPMVRDALVPYLAQRFGTRSVGAALTLRFIGLGQSQIDQTMKTHIPLPPNVMQSSQFAGGRVDFTFSLPGDEPADRDQLARLRDAFFEHLGDSIYADNGSVTLEDCVAGLLAAGGHNLALAEVGSGGNLAVGFEGTKQRHDVLAGAYVAPNEQSLRRMLEIPDDQWPATAGETTVRLLAQAAAKRVHSNWAVAVGEPQQEPASGRMFLRVACQQPDDQCEVRELPLSGSGRGDQERLATQLLDMLRRQMRAADASRNTNGT
ncbi:MAG: hypothetical protein FJ276_02440 [Planctomycetes bacterium]|nr:hypothetical protein [Planctomycetota bacterium]